MISVSQIRQQILRKISRMPANKLNDLNEYLDKLEKTTKKKSRIISYAGSWNNIDKSAFDELTANLIIRRNQNPRRFDE